MMFAIESAKLSVDQVTDAETAILLCRRVDSIVILLPLVWAPQNFICLSHFCKLRLSLLSVSLISDLQRQTRLEDGLLSLHISISPQGSIGG